MTNSPVVQCLSLGDVGVANPLVVTSVAVQDVAGLEARARAALAKEIAAGDLRTFEAELSRPNYVLLVGTPGNVGRVRDLLLAHEAELCR